jgi:hypothetical protein
MTVVPSPDGSGSSILQAVSVRPIGKKPTVKDLELVVFSPNHTFGVGDMVLVPRTKGGFTYGQITAPHEATCPFMDVKHKVSPIPRSNVFLKSPASLLDSPPPPSTFSHKLFPLCS